MLDRAAHWYRQALPGLSGLRKDEAEKRIASSRSLTSRKLVDAVAEFTWKAEAAKPRRMIQRQTGFCVLSSVSGHFMGSGELVGFYIRKDGYWYLEGKSGQAQLGVSAMSLTVRSPSWMLYDFRLFAWRQGEKPVKVIHKDEGFCVLASVGGHFAGIGEQVRVYVDEHDGYWYLGGESHQKDVQATAISVRFARPRSAAIATYRWKRGDDPVQMLKKDEGLCFLSAVSGDFRGYGESVRIGIEKDDYWYLKGSAGNELRAEATSIRIP